jgi:hypothetical protein
MPLLRREFLQAALGLGLASLIAKLASPEKRQGDRGHGQGHRDDPWRQ